MKIHVVFIISGFFLIIFYSCQNESMPVIGGAMMSDLIKPIEGRSQRSSSTYTDEEGNPINHNKDNIRVFPGEAKTVLNAKGPGVVTHMWFTFFGPGKQAWAPEGSATHQEMLLRIFYDDSDNPGVEVPFGDFFANCFGKRNEIISMPIVVEEGDSYNSFWPIPFRKSIRIEVVNQSEDKNINLLYWTIDWIQLDKLPRNTPYFYALYRQEYPVTNENNEDYVILETKGKGHYVGTVLAVRNRSPKWFGEGDEKIYIDGEDKPSIYGTGTEDYFLQAWGMKRMISTPFFGTVFFDQRGVGGHVSAYRWHIADPLTFKKSIKVTIENKGWLPSEENEERRTHSWNKREDDYSSVAYWYQTGIPTCNFTTPPAKERILPNLDIIYNASEVLKNGTYKHGNAKWQIDMDHYIDGQLTFTPDNDQASVDIPFSVAKKEPYRLLLKVTKSPDYGIWQAYLNGIKIGLPMNLYDLKAHEWEHHLLDFWPDPGEYNLKLKLIGQDYRSSDNKLGLESVRLRERRPRVKEYAFNKNNDWKLSPVLE